VFGTSRGFCSVVALTALFLFAVRHLPARTLFKVGVGQRSFVTE